MLREWTNNILQDSMLLYRQKRDDSHRSVSSKYAILGFSSSGTYGRDGQLHAIKKFKPDKEGDVVTFTGISQSAIREISVCSPPFQHCFGSCIHSFRERLARCCRYARVLEYEEIRSVCISVFFNFFLA